MKKLLFILAISGLVFTSCQNAGKKKTDAKAETHQHDGCKHDHDHEGHDHGDGHHSHDANHHQEEFSVDTTKHKCEGHDHDHDHDHEHDHDHGHKH